MDHGSLTCEMSMTSCQDDYIAWDVAWKTGAHVVVVLLTRFWSGRHVGAVPFSVSQCRRNRLKQNLGSGPEDTTLTSLAMLKRKLQVCCWPWDIPRVYNQTETKVSSLKVCFFLSFHAAEEAFKKLEQARDVLVDRQKRALYDQWRSGGFASLGITFKQWMKQPAFHSVSTLQQGYTLVAWCALDCMQQTVCTGLEHHRPASYPGSRWTWG